MGFQQEDDILPLGKQQVNLRWGLAPDGGWCGAGAGAGGAVAPEFGGWHYEFDGYLGLAHETGTEAGDAAEQFFLGVHVLDADDLLDVYLGSQQDESAVRIDDDGVSLFFDRVLLGVLQAHQNGNTHVDAFAAAPILRRQVVWVDGHWITVASTCCVLNG